MPVHREFRARFLAFRQIEQGVHRPLASIQDRPLSDLLQIGGIYEREDLYEEPDNPEKLSNLYRLLLERYAKGNTYSGFENRPIA